MNWITAVFCFISIYALAGLVHTFIQQGSRDSLLFFGIGFGFFAVLAGLNEIRLRAKARAQGNDPAAPR